jgi:type I restriction enzyme S subunit
MLECFPKDRTCGDDFGIFRSFCYPPKRNYMIECVTYIKYETIKNARSSYYEKLGEIVKNIDDILPFEVPKNWTWVRIKHISSTIQYGLSNSAEMQGNYKLLRITDIQNGSVIWERVPYTTVSENEIKQFALCNDDLLFARTGGTVGKSFFVAGLKEKSVFASYLIRIRTLEVFSKYIKAFFESDWYWQQITDKSAGTGQPNVNGVKLGDLLIPLPPFVEQKRIVQEIDKLFEQIQLIKS